jgi:type I restriction enzyme M protein
MSEPVALRLPRFREVAIGTLDDLLRHVCVEQPCRHWIYRGVKDRSFRLVATLGRLQEYMSRQTDRDEIERAYLAGTHAALRPNDPNFPYDFALAAAAQHHGAPTRLLDWTKSPLIALYFAVEPKVAFDGTLIAANSDAAIYAAHCCPSFKDFRALQFPFGDEKLGSFAIEPPIASARVAVQQSVFTIAADATAPLEQQPSALVTEIIKFVLPQAIIDDAQRRLHRLGITRRMLFPDADGINSSLIADRALDEALAARCQVAA